MAAYSMSETPNDYATPGPHPADRANAWARRTIAAHGATFASAAPEMDPLTQGIAYCRAPANLPRRLRDLAEIAVLSERTLASGTADTPIKGSVLRFIAQALRGIADEVAPERPVVRPQCPVEARNGANRTDDQADADRAILGDSGASGGVR